MPEHALPEKKAVGSFSSGRGRCLKRNIPFELYFLYLLACRFTRLSSRTRRRRSDGDGVRNAVLMGESNGWHGYQGGGGGVMLPRDSVVVGSLRWTIAL